MNFFWLQLRGELRKMFSRKRTYIGFGAFLAVELMILWLLRLERVQKSIGRVIEGSGYVAGDYLSGLTLAFFILLSTIMLLGALYLALVSGDVVSKEVEDGTMRMILCRPSSRGRILLVKILACAVYTGALMLFIAITALLAGLAHSGAGGMFVFAPAEKVFALHAFGPGLLRYFAVIPIMTFCLFTITAVGFFFSCLKMKPAAATIVTLSIFFVDTIMKNIPYFESLRDWFITARMTTWVNLFQYRIPWERMLEDCAWLGGINATLLVAAWILFERRDFKA